MPQGAATAEASLLTVTARSLTLLRLAATAPFVWLFVSGDGFPLAALFGAVALSDWLDGRMARRAGTASARWGVYDAVADITFNFAGLAVAAWRGAIGPWVPAAMALLAGRFLARSLSAPAVVYDGTGNLAGVLYYVLVGVIVANEWLGIPGGWLVARAGDAVFLYTLYALLGGSFRKSSE